MAMGGAPAPELPPEQSPEMPPAPMSDLDQDETDGFGATDAAVGGMEELGREKR